MPRGRKPDIFTAVRAQAARALRLLQDEIRQRQADLAHMVAQAESWRTLLGGGSPGRGPGRPPKAAAAKPAAGRRARGGKRVSWDDVLGSVPKVFNISDVLKHPGAASKGKAQIYPAFNRWEAAGRIKRVAKGQYEKVGGEGKAAAATGGKRKAGRPAKGRKGAKRGAKGKPGRKPKAAAPAAS